MPRIFQARTCKPTGGAYGFTLVESVIALLVLALVMTATTWTAAVLLREHAAMAERSMAWLALESETARRFAGLERATDDVPAFRFEEAILEPPGSDFAWTRLTVRSRESTIALASVSLLNH